MGNSEFSVYIENDKKGVVDSKTKKVILHSSYDVDCIDDDKIYLKNGEVLLIEDVLKKVDFIAQRQRYIIVEDDASKKLGVFDTKFNVLRVPCVCDKIQYLYNKNAFLIVKKGKKNEITYHNVGKFRSFHRGTGIILVNNLSLYYSSPFEIDLKNGKKVELKK